ncbi:hypothetical protein B0T16DRAFT_398889 [Cercophora newfieldiana]|uniref:Uncharacterized protein n=1 Tax=Cercophora newfieldiana TaxID=92897 RepID=A0AA40D0X6_9PEZI|nr:hypothetical protein B0T16DRAFT_398889 [Cercophora newfieldiana]
MFPQVNPGLVDYSCLFKLDGSPPHPLHQLRIPTLPGSGHGEKPPPKNNPSCRPVSGVVSALPRSFRSIPSVQTSPHGRALPSSDITTVPSAETTAP